MNDKTTSHSTRPPPEPTVEELEKSVQKVCADVIVNAKCLQDQLDVIHKLHKDGDLEKTAMKVNARLTKARVRQARRVIREVANALGEMLKQAS